MSLRKGDDHWSDKTMKTSGEVILDRKWLRTKYFHLPKTGHNIVYFQLPPHTNSNITLKMRMEKILNGLSSFGNEDSISAASEMGFEIGVQSWGKKLHFWFSKLIVSETCTFYI